MAAAKGKEEIVKLLLNRGADKETKDSDGHNAAFFAAENEHEVVLKLLEQNNAEMEEDLGRGAAEEGNRED